MSHERSAAGWRRACLGALAALLPSLAIAAATGREGVGSPDPAARVRRAAAATDTAAFELFGWVSPPADSTTEARIAEMAGIGLNLTLPAWEDAGRVADNLARLDWAAAHGLRCLIWDERLIGALAWRPTFEDTLDQVVRDYRGHPAFYGYYLGDEPPRDEWPLLSRLRGALRARDPDHPAWNNLQGRGAFADRAAFESYLRDFAVAESPTMLCADHYDFAIAGDREQFVENAAALRAVADSAGLPFWDIVQVIPHGIFRPLVPGELRWQVAQLLAYGARGIGYFTYWTPDRDSVFGDGQGIIGRDGTRTAWYEFLLDFDRGVRAAGETLARARWRRTTHAGSRPAGGLAFTPDDRIAGVEGRAALGEFDGEGGERLVLVANSDSIAARTVTLHLAAPADVRVLATGSSVPPTPGAPAGWNGEVALALEAGDFALLAVDPLAEHPAALALAPNPARGAVRFAPVTPAGGGRFEILDLSGRRMWERALGPGVNVIEWRGERDDGGLARPGLYFARVSGAGAGARRRFAWLGAR